MKVLSEKLSDDYYAKMRSILERQKISLKQFNIVKKNIWQQLVDDRYVLKNDLKSFHVVSKFVDDYFQKTNHVVDYGRLVALIGGY